MASVSKKDKEEKKPAPAKPQEEEEEDDVSDLESGEDEEEDEEDEDKDLGLTDPEVVTKYKLASDMANRVVKKVADACVEGAATLALCKMGDALIAEETSKVYTKKVNGKTVPKGVAFPTCISINSVVCHHCPLDSDAPTLIKSGDVVKIDLGVHLGGYIATVASTVIVGASKENPLTGPVANAVLACHFAIEAALRLLRPGVNTAEITKAVQKIAEDFGCKPVEGMLSHQLGRNVIDGEKAIIFNPTEQQKKDHKDSEVAVNEVYALDIHISTGDGKARVGDQRATVLKRTDNSYQLKMRHARGLLSEVAKTFGYMPFALRSCADEKKAKMGVVECVKHGVLQPYEMFYEKDGAVTVQCKMEVLLLPSGTLRITTGALPLDSVKSELKVTDETLQKLLATSISGKSKKKKGKKKGAAKKAEGGAAAAEEEEEDGEEEPAAAAKA